MTRLRVRSGADIHLADAFDAPGCPLCRERRRTEAAYLESILSESVNDVAYRQGLDAARGFCGRHARAFLDADRARAGSLGASILLRATLVARLRDVEAAAERAWQVPRTQGRGRAPPARMPRVRTGRPRGRTVGRDRRQAQRGSRVGRGGRRRAVLPRPSPRAHGRPAGAGVVARDRGPPRRAAAGAPRQARAVRARVRARPATPPDRRPAGVRGRGRGPARRPARFNGRPGPYARDERDGCPRGADHGRVRRGQDDARRGARGPAGVRRRPRGRDRPRLARLVRGAGGVGRARGPAHHARAPRHDRGAVRGPRRRAARHRGLDPVGDARPVRDRGRRPAGDRRAASQPGARPTASRGRSQRVPGRRPRDGPRAPRRGRCRGRRAGRVRLDDRRRRPGRRACRGRPREARLAGR